MKNAKPKRRVSPYAFFSPQLQANDEVAFQESLVYRTRQELLEHVRDERRVTESIAEMNERKQALEKSSITADIHRSCIRQQPAQSRSGIKLPPTEHQQSGVFQTVDGHGQVLDDLVQRQIANNVGNLLL